MFVPNLLVHRDIIWTVIVDKYIFGSYDHNDPPPPQKFVASV